MAIEKVDWIWMDGEMVRWDDAQVHVLTHSMHYGYAAFEGIRAYPQVGGGSAIFRLSEHMKRLYNSAHIIMLDIPYKKEELAQACRDVVKKNNLTDGCYIRPLVYMGYGSMGLGALDCPTKVTVAAWKWGAYLGEEGIRNGIRAVVSSFRRPRGDAILAKAKLTGQYVGNILAKRGALRGGYQEAIMLDSSGFVCEATGENVFMVESGRVRTPFLGEAILGGITRDTILKILEDEQIPLYTGPFTRDELYCADEVFLSGTAAEITPVREVDNRKIGTGQPGPVTKKLQERYHAIVRGEDEKYRHFLTPV
jgi:branched-chain amino acid aminotransferase